MSEYTSIYRRFRPKTFDEVIGQKHIVQILTNQIKSNEIGHAYLFTGTRGTGKTSCAKIFSRAINCLNPVNGSPCYKCANCKALSGQDAIDIIEMDAASNNSVDDIRNITDKVMYRPTYGKYKVYIIDEVHMLSSSAFNALLKTLEEPPEHIVFILATTEVQKIPATILSRCMRFDFRLLNLSDLTGILKHIYDELNIEYEDEAITRIAMAGEGSVRDTLSVADMCRAYCNGKIKYSDVADILCTTDFQTIDELANAILSGDVSSALTIMNSLLQNGRNTVIKDLGQYISDLIMVKNTKKYDFIVRTPDELDALRERVNDFTNYRLFRTLKIIAEIENQLKNTTQTSIVIQANIVKACEMTQDVDKESLQLRINELEKEIRDLKKNGVKVNNSYQPQFFNFDLSKQEDNKADVQEQNKNDDNSVEFNLTKVEDSESDNPLDKKDEEDDTIIGSISDIWTRFKEELSTTPKKSLFGAISSLNNVPISFTNNTLKIKFKQESFEYNVLNNPENIEIMTNVLCRVNGAGSKVIVELDNKNAVNKISEQSLNNLQNMFGKINKK
ncbi:MAG: DNA polymerase III subunit gamma/tau [Clostridia bacterium]|nr:DNA polymerase III subunit gamma/tau [Clostridia bacterium]